MAQIRKTSNGAYRVIVFLGRDSEGKAIYKYTTYHPVANTEKAIAKEVDNYARDFERRILQGEYYSGEDITFNTFAKRWDEEWASDHLTQSVREEYNANLRRWADKTIGHMPLSKIKATHLQSLIQKMKNEGKKTKTIKKIFASISSVLKYAYKLDIIKENPVNRCEFPKEDMDESLHYFTLEQAKAFLDSLDNEYSFTYKAHTSHLGRTGSNWNVQEYQQTHRVGTQWKAFFYLAIYGGFRRGELLGLTWKDIDFKKQTISITKAVARTSEGQIVKAPKTKSSKRVVTMPSKCFDVLRVWKKEEISQSLALGTEWKGYRGEQFELNPIFIQMDCGEGMHLDTPRERFKALIDLYNSNKDECDKLPQIRLHDLRHTSATLLLSENVDIETVSHRLGHSKASVTLDVYGHALETKDSLASDKLEMLFA